MVEFVHVGIIAFGCGVEDVVWPGEFEFEFEFALRAPKTDVYPGPARVVCASSAPARVSRSLYSSPAGRNEHPDKIPYAPPLTHALARGAGLRELCVLIQSAFALVFGLPAVTAEAEKLEGASVRARALRPRNCPYI